MKSNSSKEITLSKSYDLVYISPHLDDVILSCGEQICYMSRMGIEVLIVTIFAGQPLYGEYSDRADDFISVFLDTRTRIKEDIFACECVAADHIHLDYLEALARKNDVGDLLYGSLDSVVGNIIDYDLQVLVPTLGEELARVLGEITVLIPAARSKHIDHKLARIASEQYLNVIAYYDDSPFFAGVELSTSFNLLNLPEEEHIVKGSRLDLENKISAISKYASQLDFLFGDSRISIIESVLGKYRALSDGERLWIKDIYNPILHILDYDL